MKAYFRAIAAWFGGPTPAQAVAGVSLLVLTLYTGYNIPEPYMIGALRWITYINVCITASHSLNRNIYLWFVFPAAEIRIRGDHDERVQDAQFRVFESHPSRSRLREHHVAEPGLRGSRCHSWADDGQWSPIPQA